MTREEKNAFVEELSGAISESNVFYLTDVAAVDPRTQRFIEPIKFVGFTEYLSA